MRRQGRFATAVALRGISRIDASSPKISPSPTLAMTLFFGELASISDMPRSAPAVANLPCRLIGLDDGQFQGALRKKPEFALMLMSVMIRRIRDALARRNP